MPLLVPTMSSDRIAAALAAAIGKTVTGVFLAEYSRERWRVIVCLGDGSHYELYGTGTISGSRSCEPGDVDDVRRRLMDDAAVRITEISAETAGRR